MRGFGQSDADGGNEFADHYARLYPPVDYVTGAPSMILLQHSNRFALYSYGNGQAYRLLDKEHNQEVFVQGDDADAMRTDWEAIEAVNPLWSADMVLAWLWSECGYDVLARPVAQ